MAGMIGVGEGYKNQALSGFIRESAEQQKIDQANKDLEAQHNEQVVRNISSGVGAAASIALAVVVLC